MVELDVSHFVAENAGVGDVGEFYFFTFYLESQVFVVSRAEDFHGVGGVWLSAHGQVDGLDATALRRLSVDAEDAVADSQTCFRGGTILHHVGDYDVLVNLLQGDIDVSGLAGVPHAVALNLRFGVINRVGIEALEHGFDGSLGEFAGGDFIGVLVVQLVEHADENVNVFDDFKVVLGSYARKQP